MVTRSKPANYIVKTTDVDGRSRRTFRSRAGAEKYFKAMSGLTFAQAIDETYFLGFKPTVEQLTGIVAISSFGTRIQLDVVGEAFAVANQARLAAVEAWRAAGKPNMGDPVDDWVNAANQIPALEESRVYDEWASDIDSPLDVDAENAAADARHDAIVAPSMDGWALIQCDLNSSELGDVLGTYPTEHQALEAGNDLSDTTKAMGLYVAKRKADGHWERRLEARDRNEREDNDYLEAQYAELAREPEFPAGEFPF